MKDSLLKYISQNSTLTSAEIKNLVELFRVKHLSKGELWINQDESCEDIAFVTYGILRVFSINFEEEITLEFVFPDSFTTAQQYSFMSHGTKIIYGNHTGIC